MKTSLRTVILIAAAVIVAAVIFIGGVEIYFAASATGKTETLSAGTRYIAHRGLSSVYYQNSEQAFAAAGQSDFFYGIETDVWLTKDGKWVCCHDKNPFADPSVTIGSINYADALRVPLSPDKAGTAYAEGDVYLCGLERYLEICKEYGKTPIIEIKFAASEGELRSLAEIVSRYFASDGIQYISFHKKVVDTLFSMDDTLTVQWLINKERNAYFGSRCGYNLGLNKAILTPSVIKTAHGKNLIVAVWTVNDREEAQKLEEMCVDYITTDYDFSKIPKNT